MIKNFSELPPIPDQYVGIHEQYCTKSNLVKPDINVLEDACRKTYFYGDDKPAPRAYNDWIDYLALTCMVYGSARVKRLIADSHLRSDYKRHILRDLDYNSSSRSVRDFVLLLLTEMYGYHAKVIDIAFSTVSTDAYISSITDTDAFDEIMLLGTSLKPEGFDDILWDQFIWSYV